MFSSVLGLSRSTSRNSARFAGGQAGVHRAFSSSRNCSKARATSADCRHRGSISRSGLLMLEGAIECFLLGSGGARGSGTISQIHLAGDGMRSTGWRGCGT